MLTRRSSRAKVRNVRLMSLSPPRIRRRKGSKQTRDSSPAPKRTKDTPSRIPRPLPLRPEHGESIAYALQDRNVDSDDQSEQGEVPIEWPPSRQGQHNLPVSRRGPAHGLHTNHALSQTHHPDAFETGEHGPPLAYPSTDYQGVQGPPFHSRDPYRGDVSVGVHGPSASSVGYQNNKVDTTYAQGMGGSRSAAGSHPSYQEVHECSSSDALQQAVSDILGSTDHAGQCVRSIANSSGIGLPLGATLPQRIRAKIVSGEFVELSQILYPGGDDVSLRVCIGEDGTKALNLDPPKARSIATIEMWTSYFYPNFKFCALFLRKLR